MGLRMLAKRLGEAVNRYTGGKGLAVRQRQIEA